jgi:hypothetical protein
VLQQFRGVKVSAYVSIMVVVLCHPLDVYRHGCIAFVFTASQAGQAAVVFCLNLYGLGFPWLAAHILLASVLLLQC